MRASRRDPHQRHHLHARRQLAVHPVALVALRVVLLDRPALQAGDALRARGGVREGGERSVLGPGVLRPDGDERVRHRTLRSAAIPALAAGELGEVKRETKRRRRCAAAEHRLRAAVEHIPLDIQRLEVALRPERQDCLDHRGRSSPASLRAHATMRARVRERPMPPAREAAMRAGALDGIRVLEFSVVVAGPVCGVILGDLGADVVKVEPPGGEPHRRNRAVVPNEGKLFQNFNRGKRSLVVDLGREEGRALIHRLVPRTDVVIVNYPPRRGEAAGHRLRDAAGDPAGPDLRGEHRLRDARAVGGVPRLGHRRAGLLRADGGRGQGRRGRRAAGAQGRRLGRLHDGHRHRDGRDHGPLPPRTDRRGPEGLRLAAALGDVRPGPHHHARARLRQRRARRDDGEGRRGARAWRRLPRSDRHSHVRPRAGDAVRALLQRLPGEGRRRGPRRAHQGEPRRDARGARPRGRELRRPGLRRPSTPSTSRRPSAGSR